MRNKLFTKVLGVLMLIVISLFGFVGCGGLTDETQKTITLNATTKELVVGESFTLTATTTPADATVVWSSSDENVITVNAGTVNAVAVGTATVTAKNDTATATCTVTVKAQTTPETPAVNEYTVSFKNGDKLLKEIQVNEGETATYSGVTPVKTATEQYEYVFSGWSLTEGGDAVNLGALSITENKTLFAVFTETVRNYTVTWSVNGATTSKTFAYGTVPVYDGVTPTKPTVGNTSYTFIGWSTTVSGEALATLPQVTGEATYYAVFSEVTAEMTFDIVWKNGDEILKTDTGVAYESMPTYTGATPTKEATVEVEYVFSGWSTSVDGEKLDPMPEVTANAVYYAVFEETARKYTMTWVIEGVETTSECGYGSVPTYTGATPTKADTEECSWKFVGWALTEGGEMQETLPEVSGEATFYAVFDVDVVFEAPKFVGGKILYSAKSEEIFLPEGLLATGVSIVSAVVKADGVADVVAYQDGAWVHEAITLTDEELKGNLVGERALEVELSNGEEYGVDMNVYAGVIDELSDFPAFFNNTAVPSEFAPDDYPDGVAPNVWGYYVVTKDLGTGVEELTLEQTMATDYNKGNGFNGVLDGQGHTLRFKLMKGGLVGRILGNNAVIKNLGVIYEDCSYDETDRYNTGHGVFGYMAVGYAEIRNCYIERTNELFSRSSVYGIMARPNNKLTVHNTVVYGYNVKEDCNWWTNPDSSKFNNINETSKNVYVIHARNVAEYMSVNFTKVFDDALQNASREVLLSEIEDASGFVDDYWYKENGKLIWKGLGTATVSFVDGEDTTSEVVSKGSVIVNDRVLPADVKTDTEITKTYWSTEEDGDEVVLGSTVQVNGDVTYYLVTKTSTRYYTVTWVIGGEETTTDYEFNQVATHDDPVKAEDELFSYTFLGWSTEENGEVAPLGAVTTDGIVYYAVFDKTAKKDITEISQPILYSSIDNELFLPDEIGFEFDETITVSSMDFGTIYYENGEWLNTFAITEEQMLANAVGTLEIIIENATGYYFATVKSYAGVIDELSDFNTFFDNDTTANAPSVYGYYIVTKDLGTGTEELALTQSRNHGNKATDGFNGILDGQGHTLRFTLKSGGLVGMVLGNGVIQNLGVIFKDATDLAFGLFGEVANGAPVIRNCYIEATEDRYMRRTTFGIIDRPRERLIIENTVVYGYYTKDDSTYQGEQGARISPDSSNVYVIHARANVDQQNQSKNFTKVYADNVWDGSRSVPLADVEDANAFTDAYWYKESGRLIWKGFETATITFVEGGESMSELVTKGDCVVNGKVLPDDVITETQIQRTYWSTTEDGENEVELEATVKVNADVTYYLIEKSGTRYYTVTWVVEGADTTTEYEYNEIASHEDPVKAEDEVFTYTFKGWSTTENGEVVELGAVTTDGIVYYAVFEAVAKKEVTMLSEAILYSTDDGELFLPEEIEFTLDESFKIYSKDNAVVYYEGGEWLANFAITEAQRKANEIGSFEIVLENATDCYTATVKSYAGIIDELDDFKTFFDNDPSATAPDVYGYYIVTKNLGTGTEELALTQSMTTDYRKDNGFNGVLDGQGHTLNFTLKSGGLVGMILGNATIKNLGVIFADATEKYYGVFGYRAGGATVIENCYIQRTTGDVQRYSVYGIVGGTNQNLQLHNTVIHGANFNRDGDMNSKMYISAESTNAFVIYARSDKNAATWGISQNFTELVDSNILTSDLSSFDTTCWSVTNQNRISWVGTADSTYTVVSTAE